MIKHMSILINIQKYLMLPLQMGFLFIFIQNPIPVLPLCRVQARDPGFLVGLGRTSLPTPENKCNSCGSEFLSLQFKI